jgi:hypothetical protein
MARIECGSVIKRVAMLLSPYLLSCSAVCCDGRRWPDQLHALAANRIPEG